jgi:hypothetical protein
LTGKSMRRSPQKIRASQDESGKRAALRTESAAPAGAATLLSVDRELALLAATHGRPLLL